jgi:inner membrane protease subunit 2
MAHLKKLLWALPVPLVISNEFWTFVPVKDDSMQPHLNPDFPCSSGFEDDIVLVRRTGESADFKAMKGKIVLLRSPTHPAQLIFRKLEAVQGDWVSINTDSRRFIRQGQGWVLSSKGAADSREFDTVKAKQIPLGLILGEVTHVVWPPCRYQSLEP